MENFIGIYDNAFAPEYCERVIEWFEKSRALGFGHVRTEVEQISRHKKDDEFLFMADEPTLNLMHTGTLVSDFLGHFWSVCYKDYASKFSILDEYENHTVYNVKVQRTLPGGGYHIWHSEHSGRKASNRIAAFSLYLNDVNEGGETEFLYYGLRVEPKVGRLVIWPAGYTHTHRGNPPLKETKYIITGWIEFQ